MDAPHAASVPHTRRAWALLGHRSGDNRQVVALCEALGWPCDVKQLHYAWASHAPNLLRRATPFGVHVAGDTPLAAPWPDLVVAAGRRSAPLALQIKARSGGRSRLVQLGRPAAPVEWFDLVITTPQYHLAPHANVLEIPLPFGRAPEPADAAIARHLDALPRPRIAVLIGGPTTEVRFGPAEAQGLLAHLRRLRERLGGSFVATTSPRTPPEVVTALRHTLPAPAHLHEWRANVPNPYGTFLATADAVVVSGDSVSMIADACRTGLPVGISRLPRRHAGMEEAWAAAYRWLVGRAAHRDPASRLLSGLVNAGLIVSPRDHEAVHRILEQRGLAATLPAALPAADTAPARRNAMAAWERTAVERVTALFEAEL